MEENTYNIQRVWTELDFEQMEWHDCRIYGFASYPESFEVAFDIDYICEWIMPIAPATHYEFRTAPATLVFWNVRDLVIDIDSGDATLDIDSIKRTLVGVPINSKFIDRQEEWEWSLELGYGQIKLHSVGYHLYLRQIPKIRRKQRLDLKERGEISFARKGWDQS